MIGNLISAGASLIGGYMNKKSAERASEQTAAQAQMNRQMQKQFAQEGIRWRVRDAKEAGIHPLYALGANIPSYTPSSASFAADNSMGNALSSAGQDIGRAINATRTGPERADAFTKSMAAIQLESAGLDLEIKKTQLASSLQRLKANANPPIPTTGTFDVPQGTKAEEMPPLMMGGERVLTNKNTSNAEDFEKRYGDDGPASWAAGLGVLYNDAVAMYGQPAQWPTQLVNWFGRNLAVELRNEVANAKRFFGRR